MKFTLRLVSAIWLSVMLVIGAFAYLQIRDERERLVGDLQRRAVLIGEGLSDALEPAAARQSGAAVERILKKLGPAQRAIAVYDRFATLMAATPDIAGTLPPSLPEVTDTVSRNLPTQGFRVIGDVNRFVYATPLIYENQPVGAVAVFLDASHLNQIEWDRWSYSAIRFLVLAAVISIIAALVVKVSITRPMADLGVDARAPQRAPGAAAQRRRRQPVRAARPRGLAPRAQHAARPGRRAAGGGAAPVRRERVDRGAAEAVRRPAACRPAAGRRLEPRAGEPRVAGQPDPRAGAGQRSGDGDGSGHARVRRGVGRARQWRRRP